MKTYPSIPKDILTGEPILAFDKLDGSNIRAEWSKKRGFYKFGTRRRLLDPNEPVLGQAVGILMEKYSEALAQFARDQRHQRCMFFFEFFGPNSFAGNHDEEDEFDLVLIDVAPYKRGMLPPRDFVKHFSDLHIPEVLYEGKANQPFVESVRNSELDGMTFEGVVCKSQSGKTFKVKSQAWLDALKTKCGDDESLFERLA